MRNDLPIGGEAAPSILANAQFYTASVTFRTPHETIRRVIPLKRMLSPNRVPIIHTEFEGQWPMIIKPRMAVTIASNRTQPQPCNGRI